MTSLRLVTLLFTTGLLSLAQSSWTPYVAQYTQIAKVTYSNGKTTLQQITGQEERSSDGSLVTTVISNGKQVRGTYWDAATGKITKVNFIDGRGVLYRTEKRVHLSNKHSDLPVGSQIVAGVSCIGYPEHLSNPASHGSGVAWVDQADGIIMKEEIHDHVSGNDIVFTKAITNISFVEPLPESMKIPANIKMVTPPVPAQK